MSLDEFVAFVEGSSYSNSFYHFTDAKNLPSIRNYGLLSMRELRRREIAVPAPGGNQHSMDADVLFGVDAFLHLTFKTGHPMEKGAKDDGRITDLRHLRIHPSILLGDGVMGTSEVANKSGVVPCPIAELVDQLDLGVLYKRTNWNDSAIQERLKIAEKFEILVPMIVPLKYFRD